MTQLSEADQSRSPAFGVEVFAVELLSKKRRGFGGSSPGEAFNRRSYEIGVLVGCQELFEGWDNARILFGSEAVKDLGFFRGREFRVVEEFEDGFESPGIFQLSKCVESATAKVGGAAFEDLSERLLGSGSSCDTQKRYQRVF